MTDPSTLFDLFPGTASTAPPATAPATAPPPATSGELYGFPSGFTSVTSNYNLSAKIPLKTYVKSGQVKTANVPKYLWNAETYRPKIFYDKHPIAAESKSNVILHQTNKNIMDFPNQNKHFKNLMLTNNGNQEIIKQMITLIIKIVSKIPILFHIQFHCHYMFQAQKFI